MSSSMSRHLSTRNISFNFVHAFLSNLAKRQTYRQTNTSKKHLPPPMSEVKMVDCDVLGQVQFCRTDLVHVTPTKMSPIWQLRTLTFTRPMSDPHSVGTYNTRLLWYSHFRHIVRCQNFHHNIQGVPEKQPQNVLHIINVEPFATESRRSRQKRSAHISEQFSESHVTHSCIVIVH